MICRKCKQEVPDGAFCNLCGIRQEKPSRAPKRRGNGQGSAYKRGNTWTGQSPTQYYYTTDKDGKRTQHKKCQKKGGFATKKEALAWAVSASSVKETPVPRLIDLWEGWSANDMQKLSKSKQTACNIARKRLESIITRPINLLTVDELQNIINTECKTYYPARDVKTLLSHLYQRAMASNSNNGRVTQNLSKFLVLPEPEETEATPFTSEEVRALWAQYDKGDTFVGYILLLIYTGMMPVELMNCKKSMIDLDACEIRGAGAKTKVRKKSAIVFPDTIKPLMEDLLAVESSNSRANMDKLICINKDNFYSGFYEALERSGISNPVDKKGNHKLTPYSCRHTYGTEAVKSGLHPAVIQKMLRHASTKMQERYTHLSSEDAHTGANRISFLEKPVQ